MTVTQLNPVILRSPILYTHISVLFCLMITASHFCGHLTNFDDESEAVIRVDFKQVDKPLIILMH